MALPKKLLTCSSPPELTPAQRLRAYRLATRHNPANAPAGVHEPPRAAMLASAYWGAKGVSLTVGFMETIAAGLRDKILSHMNSWGPSFAGANVTFRWTQTSPQVRISRGRGGYWSYLGVDVLAIPRSQQTMNLEGFSASTPESEFFRVVRHETGHTLGFPHEHLRPALVALLDAEKVIAWGKDTQGWSRQQSIDQMLTPLTESSLLGATPADAASIMAYHFDGSLTKDGQPVIGGSDIDAFDRQCVDGLYPLAVTPPPPPAGGGWKYALSIDKTTGAATIAPA